MQPRFDDPRERGGVVDDSRTPSSARSGTRPAPRRRSRDGFAGTRFWWKKSPSTPFGNRFMWNGRRRRCGSAQPGDVEVVGDEVALRQARAPGRRPCPGSRSRRRDGRCARADHARRRAARSRCRVSDSAGDVARCAQRIDSPRRARGSRSCCVGRGGERRHGPRDAAAGPSASCAKASLQLVNDGTLTVGTDNPAYPPWYAGGDDEGLVVEDQRPVDRQGLRVGRRLRGREAARLRARPGEVDRTCRSTARSRPGKKSFDFDINQISYTPARAKVVTFSSLVLRRQPGARRAQGDADREGALGRRAAPLQARRAARHDELRLHQGRDQADARQPSVFPQNAAAVQALKNKQIDGLVVDLPTAFYVTAVAGAELDDPRAVPDARRAVSTSGWCFAKGNPLAALRRRGARDAEGERHAAARSSSSG